jgi:hypothetical protein
MHREIDSFGGKRVKSVEETDFKSASAWSFGQFWVS